MDCSIIIPTYNTRDLTLRCVKGLSEAPPALNHEIIVVDNGSSDGTVGRLNQEYPLVKTLENGRNLGFAKACNRGARLARGRFLCFLNSDTEHAGSGIGRLSCWLDEHPKTGIVGPALQSAQGEVIQMSWVWNPILAGELVQQYLAPYALRRSSLRRSCVTRLQHRSRTVPIICGACLMIRRKVFDQIGGFDEDFELYFEDSDLCYRCRQSGWSIDFDAEAKVIHHLGQSASGSWTVTSLIYQQSHLAYYRKHASRAAVILLKLYLLMKLFRLALVPLFNPKERTRSKPYRRAYLDMILERRRFTLAEGIPA